MIHARHGGESFGLACAEFSSANKPVITYGMSSQRAHLDILGDTALIYNNPRDLMEILLNISQQDVSSKNWDVYTRIFSPHRVMQKFKDAFLTDISQDMRLTELDKLVVRGHRLRKKLRKLYANLD